MGRPYDPARAMRERLKVLEARARGHAEARAVAEGVAETVSLARSRGAAFEKPAARRGERETPYRRQTGLDWLLRKGRISEGQKAAGVLAPRGIGADDRLDAGGATERRPGGRTFAEPDPEAGGGTPTGAGRTDGVPGAAIRPVGSGDRVRPGLRPGTDTARGGRRRARRRADRGGAEGGAGYIGDAAGSRDHSGASTLRVCVGMSSSKARPCAVRHLAVTNLVPCRLEHGAVTRPSV
jgi:hypothetical protein